MTAQEAYRCAACGHGRKLKACAAVIAYGPLGADGELSSHEYDDDIEVHEDSIACSEHPDGEIEKNIDGTWHRWWSCRACLGRGATGIGSQERVCYEKTPWGGHRTFFGRDFPGQHAGWLPMSDPAWKQVVSPRNL